MPLSYQNGEPGVNERGELVPRHRHQTNGVCDDMPGLKAALAVFGGIVVPLVVLAAVAAGDEMKAGNRSESGGLSRPPVDLAAPSGTERALFALG
jgi:hypothetical protein